MDLKKKLQDLKKYFKEGPEKYKARERAEFAAGKYNPLADNSAYRQASQDRFIEGIKAPFKAAKARKETRGNIKSMANTAARMQLMEDRENLSTRDKGYKNLSARQDRAYKTTLKDLRKQVPKKYR